MDKGTEVLVEVLIRAYARAICVPMSLVDGRPWVPTEEEAFG